MATFRKKDPRQGVDSDEETVRAAEKAIQDGFAEKKGVLKSLFAAKPPKTAPRGPARENGGKRHWVPMTAMGAPRGRFSPCAYAPRRLRWPLEARLRMPILYAIGPGKRSF